MGIEFQNINSFPRGTLKNMLIDAYSFEPRFERDWHVQWQEFDDFFYDNPKIAETCGFITTSGGVPIGFVTWNPTNLPVSVEIGHNCILSKYKGNGYGKAQMIEAVKRITKLKPDKIVVWTNDICVPAQFTYTKAGFHFVGKSAETYHPEYSGQRIHYEINL